jgi:hypothetical protein
LEKGGMDNNMDLGGIGGVAFSLIFKILMVVVVLCVAAAGWFVSHKFFRWKQEIRNYKIKANIYNPDGSFYKRMIGKFKDKDGMEKMKMIQIKNFFGYYKDPETLPVFEPKYIRNNCVTLLRYGVGQFAIVDPERFSAADPKKFGIKLINIQMKNFAFLELRAGALRWSELRKNLSKYTKWISVVFICIAACVAIWMVMKTAIYMFDRVAAERTAECAKMIINNVTSSPSG